VTKNFPVAEAVEWVGANLAGEFRSALLCTTRRDWQLIVTESGAARLVAHKPSSPTPPSRAHDQARPGLLANSARDWLQGLDVCDASGKVRARRADKYRQINRYLEILSHLAADCGWIASQPDPSREAPGEGEAARATKLRAQGENLVLADMGCGKGYLTFAAWQLFRRQLGLPISILGLEARPDLVDFTQRLASRIGAQDLQFLRGPIDSVELPRLDALIALHACDTATDDAIVRGIDSGAQLIVIAPCCHQELRPQLGRPAPLAPVLCHGVMAERMAKWLTDGLRALYLEWAGYRTKLLEFVATEHTPKNLMLAALRAGRPFSDPSARERIEQLKGFFGIQHHALDRIFVDDELGRG
jgi:hypothetical protein